MATGQPSTVARFLQRPAWSFDAAVTVLVAIPAISGVLVHHGNGTLAQRALLTTALILPLIARRRFPVAVFGVLASVAFVQWLMAVKLTADITLLVGMYTIAATQTWRRILAAAAVMELGILLALLRWAHGDWLAGVFMTGMVTAAIALGFYFRTRRAYLDQLRQRAEQLERDRDRQGALAAAAERARIAREMHDIVAHHLTVMVALSDGALAAAATSPERAAAAMKSVSAVGRTALADTRRLLGVLRESGDLPGRAPLPGLDEIEALVTGVNEAGLPAELIVRGRPPTPPAGVQLMLYRLVQEALTNTMKHAGPGARAEVSLTYESPDFQVEVTDDGLGTFGAPAPMVGHGLAGMQERVHSLGGVLEAGPCDRGGWRVHARIPLGTADPAFDVSAQA